MLRIYAQTFTVDLTEEEEQVLIVCLVQESIDQPIGLEKPNRQAAGISVQHETTLGETAFHVGTDEKVVVRAYVLAADRLVADTRTRTPFSWRKRSPSGRKQA